MLPLLLIGGSLAVLIIAALSAADDKPLPDNPPDYQPMGVVGKTGWKRVDAIMGELQRASQSSGIPLGVLVGWICKESGGRLDSTTKYDERGLLQAMPAESAKLGSDHQRLSTDLQYSINEGLKLVAMYMGAVDRLGVAPRGSNFYFRLVKLTHSMGSGAVPKIIAMAQAAGDARSWADLEAFALENDSEILHATKHSAKKWFPFVDSVAQVGEPFGFGSGSASTVVGGSVFTDIVDPLDCF